MITKKSIFKIYPILLIIILFLGVVPSENAASASALNNEGLSTQSDINVNDWAQIKTLLPGASSIPDTQQAYIKASNTGIGDHFGYAVSVSGDTVAVGAYYEDSNATGVNGDAANNSAADSGAVYIFTYAGGTWSQQAYLKASNTGAEDYFGTAVSISGDTLVVGANEEDSNATGINGNQADNSTNASGAAYIFTRTGNVWTQQAYLKASNTDADDQFGTTVSISGDTVAIGSWGEDSNANGVNGDQGNNSLDASGAVYVFTRSGTTWSQQAYLKASNTESSDAFSSAISLSDNTLVVGAVGESSNATGVNGNEGNNSELFSGAAYVFTRSGTTWSQQAYLKASNTENSDAFGSAVSVSGDTVVVGAHEEDSNATGVNGDEEDNSEGFSGAAYVFTRSGTIWSQQAYLKASNSGSIDQFGSAISLSGNTLVVGAFGESSNATGTNGNQADDYLYFASGAAYVFTRSGTTWSQQAYLKASNTGAEDYFGWAVSVDGNRLVIGADEESSNATGVNGDGTNNTGYISGAAYIFSTTPIFTDVSFSYWANTYIERLFNAGITGGCGTGIYCPDNSVTRAQMAIFLLKGIHGSSYTPPVVGGSTGFGDVATNYWAAAWIKQLAAEGITGGCGGGNYCPDNTVTRAQMAVFLMKAKNGSNYSPPGVGGSTGFSDVATNYWAAAFIKQLVADSITAGCGNGNYCPEDSVTRAQMAVFLVKAFNLP
ncbi:MAG: S-layer homology domain-containing protein [Anaerolineales bacterium]|nr:S-layer homology domain-containing protein [Anaerolineales bacterium]